MEAFCVWEGWIPILVQSTVSVYSSVQRMIDLIPFDMNFILLSPCMESMYPCIASLWKIH